MTKMKLPILKPLDIPHSKVDLKIIFNPERNIPKEQIVQQGYAPVFDSNFQRGICFKHVKAYTTEVSIAHILLQDLTSKYSQTTEFTDEYVKDLSVNFTKIIKQDLKPYFFETELKNRYNYLIIDISKIHGVIFLGLMNLFKATTENPTIPITYCYMKETFPDLKLYQRLVLCNVLCPKKYVKNFVLNCGQHHTFNARTIKNVDNLTFKKVVETWIRDKKNLLGENIKPLSETKCFNLSEDSSSYYNTVDQYISMNHQWLPEPWSHPGSSVSSKSGGFILCQESIDAYMNDKVIKDLPLELYRNYILGIINSKS